jgi:hypothetical protein
MKKPSLEVKRCQKLVRSTGNAMVRASKVAKANWKKFEALDRAYNKLNKQAVKAYMKTSEAEDCADSLDSLWCVATNTYDLAKTNYLQALKTDDAETGV